MYSGLCIVSLYTTCPSLTTEDKHGHADVPYACPSETTIVYYHMDEDSLTISHCVIPLDYIACQYSHEIYSRIAGQYSHEIYSLCQ